MPLLATFGRLVALILTCCFALAGPAGAQEARLSPEVAKRLEAAISRHTHGKVVVSAANISRTPVAGIYQVFSEGEIFYVDESGRYSFSGGSLIDMASQTDLTSAQLDHLQTIDFASLPLQYALKEVHGAGRRKVALFEDPNCPVCKVFTKFVDQLDDVTVYRFMLPVIDPSSASLARKAWCSTDKAGNWRIAMAGGRLTGREDCDLRGLGEILKAAERLSVQNTPTVFLGNGRRLIGATPPDQFIAALDASGK
jgi:thiol:disulfide interchange protein DsbC